MPCPVCYMRIGRADHRLCLVSLFRSNTIKSTKEWETMSRPPTIIKGRVKVYLLKTEM